MGLFDRLSPAETAAARRTSPEDDVPHWMRRPPTDEELAHWFRLLLAVEEERGSPSPALESVLWYFEGMVFARDEVCVYNPVTHIHEPKVRYASWEEREEARKRGAREFLHTFIAVGDASVLPVTMNDDLRRGLCPYADTVKQSMEAAERRLE